VKVTISYACDLDDTPKDTANLLKNLRGELDKAITLLDNSVEEIDSNFTTESLETVDKLRQLLGKIDMRLMDCATILSGFIKAKADLASGVEIQNAQSHAIEDEEFIKQFVQPMGTQEVKIEDVLNEEAND
jgi:hypothetical protein